jgi:hypothetical protein
MWPMTARDEAAEHPLTPEDVAARQRVDRETVCRMARRGEPPALNVMSPAQVPARSQRCTEALSSVIVDARPRTATDRSCDPGPTVASPDRLLTADQLAAR